jgi:hypothetical protein
MIKHNGDTVLRNFKKAILKIEQEKKALIRKIRLETIKRLDKESPEESGQFKDDTSVSTNRDGSFKITNDSPYFNQVEYVGWGLTPPYMPFAKTELQMKFFIKKEEIKFNNKKRTI